MCGPLEYAQPLDFYLSCVNVCMSGGNKESIAKIDMLRPTETQCVNFQNALK